MNVRDLYVSITGGRSLVRTEWDTRTYLSEPIRRRLWLWRRGFLSRSGVLYDLDESNYREYVTDYQRFVRTKRINGTWSIALSNKLLFHRLLEPFDDHRMTVYGLLRDGKFHAIDSSRPVADGGMDGVSSGGPRTSNSREITELRPESSSVQPSNGQYDRDRTPVDGPSWVIDRLEDERKLVCKWIRGGGGNNVLLCEQTADGYQINGEEKSEAAFRQLLTGLEDYLVCEFVEQGTFSSELYSETPNTLRIITMYDEETDDAFVAAAIQRMGTAESYPMDNFSQGGLTAAVDIDSGGLGPGVQLPYTGELEWHSVHPDTETQIEGAEIPGWSQIRDRILEMAKTYPYLPYVGWDIVVTDEDGEFAVIEGNSYPGLKSIQVHGPLLADDRARRFYERYGVC